jgi:hypothetical protein
MHLAKLDTVFVPMVLVLFLLYRYFRGRFSPALVAFTIAYGLASLHAALHAFFIATIYTLDQSLRLLLPEFIAQPIITAIDGYQ